MVTKDDCLKTFCNNFELHRMDIFTRLPYQNFILYIKTLGGIFYYRWGDAPLKSIAVSIFVPQNQTTPILDFIYAHRDKDLIPAKRVIDLESS